MIYFRKISTNSGIDNPRRNLKKITLTSHALTRMWERTVLTENEILEIIENGETSRIGIEERSYRVHILFFSEPDNKCLVAVLDERTREIVTILPAEFDIKCRVNPAEIQRLTDIANGKIAENSCFPISNTGVTTTDSCEVDTKQKTKQVQILAIFFCFRVRRMNQGIKFFNIRISDERYPRDVEELQKSSEITALLQNFIRDKLGPFDYVEHLTVSIGRKGQRYAFTIDPD